MTIWKRTCRECGLSFASARGLATHLGMKCGGTARYIARFGNPARDDLRYVAQSSKERQASRERMEALNRERAARPSQARRNALERIETEKIEREAYEAENEAERERAKAPRPEPSDKLDFDTLLAYLNAHLPPGTPKLKR